MKRQTAAALQRLIDAYDLVVKGIDHKASGQDDRAYGGTLRAGKGMLVESLAKSLIELAWQELRRSSSRLRLEPDIVHVPLKKEYLNRVKNPYVKSFIERHLDKFYYPLKTDIHVSIDGRFKIAVECKAYTENAMLKRILVDFTLLKQVYPDLIFVLFQLESQLGGDYSTLSGNPVGSPSTHTLLSYFDVDLHIITLLEGERKVDRPIHKPQYFKALRKESIVAALEQFKGFLKQ